MLRKIVIALLFALFVSVGVSAPAPAQAGASNSVCHKGNDWDLPIEVRHYNKTTALVAPGDCARKVIGFRPVPGQKITFERGSLRFTATYKPKQWTATRNMNVKILSTRPDPRHDNDGSFGGGGEFGK